MDEEELENKFKTLEFIEDLLWYTKKVAEDNGLKIPNFSEKNPHLEVMLTQKFWLLWDIKNYIEDEILKDKMKETTDNKEFEQIIKKKSIVDADGTTCDLLMTRGKRWCIQCQINGCSVCKPLLFHSRKIAEFYWEKVLQNTKNKD